MNAHTLLRRELLMCSKRPATYWVRTVLAGCAFVGALAIVMATVRGGIDPVYAGRALFWTLGAMGMVWVLLEGVLLTVDSISKERREGTLGLLFLSNLTGHDVVAGKAGGAGMRAFFGLLAAAPAPAITFLFGGVTWWDYLQLMLVLANALLFALGLGLLVSCRERDRRATTVRGVALLLWFLLGAPAAAALALQGGQLGLAVLAGTSPVTPLVILFSQNPAWVSIFPAVMAASNLGAIAMLLGAGRRLDRGWRDEGSARIEGGPARRSRRGPLARGVNPVLWINGKRMAGPRVFWTMAGFAVLAGVVTGIFAKPGVAFFVPPGLIVLLHCTLSFEVSRRACRALAEERTSGLLEMVLTTPLSEDEIAMGHLLAVKRMVVGPFLFLVFLGMAWLVMAAMAGWPGALPMAVAYGPFLLAHVVEMHSSARFGLWKGLQRGDGGGAFRRALMMGGLGAAGAVGCAGLLALTLSPAVGAQTAIASGVLFLAAAFCAVGLGFWATTADKLADDFRAAATGGSEAG